MRQYGWTRVPRRSLCVFCIHGGRPIIAHGQAAPRAHTVARHRAFTQQSLLAQEQQAASAVPEDKPAVREEAQTAAESAPDDSTSRIIRAAQANLTLLREKTKRDEEDFLAFRRRKQLQQLIEQRDRENKYNDNEESAKLFTKSAVRTVQPQPPAIRKSKAPIIRKIMRSDPWGPAKHREAPPVKQVLSDLSGIMQDGMPRLDKPASSSSAFRRRSEPEEVEEAEDEAPKPPPPVRRRVPIDYAAKLAEQVRTVEEKKTEEQRLQEEKRMEAQRLEQEEKMEQQRLEEERRAEKQRLEEEQRMKKERDRQQKREEEALRLARERQAKEDELRRARARIEEAAFKERQAAEAARMAQARVAVPAFASRAAAFGGEMQRPASEAAESPTDDAAEEFTEDDEAMVQMLLKRKYASSTPRPAAEESMLEELMARKYSKAKASSSKPRPPPTPQPATPAMAVKEEPTTSGYIQPSRSNSTINFAATEALRPKPMSFGPARPPRSSSATNAAPAEDLRQWRGESVPNGGASVPGADTLSGFQSSHHTTRATPAQTRAFEPPASGNSSPQETNQDGASPSLPFNPELTSRWKLFKQPPRSAASERFKSPFDEYSRARELGETGRYGIAPSKSTAFGSMGRSTDTRAAQGSSARTNNDIGQAPRLGSVTAQTPVKAQPATETEKQSAIPAAAMADDKTSQSAPRRFEFPEKSAAETSRPVRSSGRFALTKDDEAPTRKPRRRRDDSDDFDEDRPRGRGRSRSNNMDDEDEGPARRGRRQERDEVEEGLSDSLALKRIRDKRDRERKERQARAIREQKRNRELAAKRANALNKIVLPQFISVTRLAQALGVKVRTMTRKMEMLGYEETSTDHVLTAENASMIALEFNFDPTISDDLQVISRDLVSRPELEDKSQLPSRPPIVTIMGHVDHGKTTILDFLRKSSIAASEHGGITQHIGAFSVRMSGGKVVTFLDTPGHAAFLAMRQRGANVTDIVILVVAADDSVKPQTLEALKHATAAKVPIVVAINKVDKPEADVTKVKRDLARHGVEIEDFGGDVQVVPVSGKTGQGMEDLEDCVVTLSEILDHRAEQEGLVEGWVLEASKEAQGRVATVLVRRGTLKVGDIIVAGETWARVRSLHNEAGTTVEEAGPGTPVEVSGWRDQPVAGDLVLEATSEQKAADVAEYRNELREREKLNEDVEAINKTRRLDQERREREKAKAADAKKGIVKATTDEDADAAESTERKTKEVPFIIKADVSGSAEAVVGYLQQLMNPVCSPKILRSGVGQPTEFDIEHASAANGHIIAFNLPPPSSEMASLAHSSKVRILEQNVIYRLLDQVKEVLEEDLEPVLSQRVVAEAEVLKTFDIKINRRKSMRIAGSRVTNGEIKRSGLVKVMRKGEMVYDGTLSSLKNVKKDVTEMRKGSECGIGFEGWHEAEEGDHVQTYEVLKEKRRLPI